MERISFEDFIKKGTGLDEELTSLLLSKVSRKRVFQHMIASYLGITPEGLSRVRKELATRQGK